MIIYTRDLNFERISALVATPERLRKYARELVPLWAQCFPNIVANQCFYVATQVRAMLSVPYKTRKEAVRVLCEDIRLNGVTTNCTTVQEVLNACNSDSLRALLVNHYERNP